MINKLLELVAKAPLGLTAFMYLFVLIALIAMLLSGL